MWTTVTVKGGEVKRGDMVSGRVVLKVKKGRKNGPVVLTHSDGYTEITRSGAIQVERLLEDEPNGNTGSGHHRRAKTDDGDVGQRQREISRFLVTVAEALEVKNGKRR